MFISGLGPMHFQFSQFVTPVSYYRISNMTDFGYEGISLLNFKNKNDSDEHIRSINGLKGIGNELTPGLICFVHWWPTHFSLFLL